MPGQHIHCLDLLRVVSAPGIANPFCDCAILLEVWEVGGLLQTSVAIPLDTVISMPSVGAGLQAKVVSCQEDDYGFLIEISVPGPGWFPEGYIPPHVMPDHMVT